MKSERGIVFLAAFTAFSLCFPARGGAAAAGKIQIMPGTPVVRLVVETDGPPASARGYYLPGAPSTFALDLGGAATGEAPGVPAVEARFIRDVQVLREGPRDIRILARLVERVPVRLRREDGRTVIEFIKVQEYSLDADVQAELARRPQGRIFLDGIDPSDAPGRVSFRVELTGRAVAQVFSLKSPWRLIVDLYDTVLRARPSGWGTEDPQVPVEKVRVGQFRMSNPRPITRLVFDLRDPCVYALDADKDGLIVSFFKNIPLGEAAVTPSVPSPPPARNAASRTEPAAKAAAAAPDDQPAAPLIRLDLLRPNKKEAAPAHRDIFRPGAAVPAASPVPSPGALSGPPQSKQPPAFALNLVYVGSVQLGGKIMALVTSEGQTLPAAVGDEIIPGYKVLRITFDEIEVEGPNAQRKTFSRQGGQP